MIADKKKTLLPYTLRFSERATYQEIHPCHGQTITYSPSLTQQMMKGVAILLSSQITHSSPEFWCILYSIWSSLHGSPDIYCEIISSLMIFYWHETLCSNVLIKMLDCGCNRKPSYKQITNVLINFCENQYITEGD
jgi:hypothetical protein